MKHWSHQFFGAILMLLATPAFAQLVNDGTTNLLSFSTNIAGPAIIGSNLPNTMLIVSNGATVVNNTNALIGGSATASNSTVILDGSGWFNVGLNAESRLSIGESSSFNRLVITNGGVMSNLFGYIGFNPGANHNQALITGLGSFWTNVSQLKVGYFGSDNAVVVSDGGQLVTGPLSQIGYAQGANNNRVIVRDSGSKLMLPLFFTLEVGLSGSSNELVIENGGWVMDSGGVLGRNSGANYNRALVTGSNSVWTNRNALSVGIDGSFNSLVISNGGRVAVNGSGGISGIVGSSNKVIVTGKTSLWSSGSVNLRTYGLLFVEDEGTVRSGGASFGNNSEAVVIGTNSAWLSESGSFSFSGSGGKLMITNAGRVDSYIASVGGAENQISVVGPASRWINQSNLNIGGVSNTLLVTEGGSVSNFTGYTGDGGNGGWTIVSGSNSAWYSYGDLYLGSSGSTNTLIVTNGGRVENSAGYVGFSSNAYGNRVVLDGTNSQWMNRSNLTLGSKGSFNHLLITNAGCVLNNSAFIGDGGNSNKVMVAGSGSAWINSGDISIGPGSGNALVIANGATVQTTNIYVGVGANSSNNVLSLNNSALVVNGGVFVNKGNTFTGEGVLGGTLTINSGGRLAPGVSIGKLLLSNSPSLQGVTMLEIDKVGAALTNDLLEVIPPLTYGGSLVVTNVGLGEFGAGESFRLFAASGYDGAFSSLTLPPLATNLVWTNKLLIDGSIQVVSWDGPKIVNPVLTGTNLIFAVSNGRPGGGFFELTSTNVALPLANWTRIGNGTFDWFGNAKLTNAISPITNLNSLPRGRFFTVQMP